MSRRVAVVLFNLGGPDAPESVRPFLFNLFNDPAIIGAPGPVRWLLAQLISRRRAPVARGIYEELGGSSPLVANTEKQARALSSALGKRLGDEADVRVFVAMRYWHPRAAETVEEVRAFGPDRIVLMPLYPQYSTTTSGSSLGEWMREARRIGLGVETSAVCCYPTAPGFVEAVVETIRETAGEDTTTGAAADSGDDRPPRILFSAHGLPKKIVAGGDPYQWQVEATAAAIGARLGAEFPDRVVCYQSRVGPLEWIGPATEDEIKRAGEERRDLLVVPIAFVSEHSETLVELDVEYAKLARDSGVERYLRAPTVDARPAFVEALTDLAVEAMTRDGIARGGGARICPTECSRCALEAA